MKMSTATKLSLVLIFSLIPAVVYTQDSTRKTLLLRPKVHSPIEVITADTTHRDTTVYSPDLPGERGISYTAEQDSAFARALRLAIPPGSRFAMATRQLVPGWEAYRAAVSNTPEMAAQRALDLPLSVFMPTPQEQTAYDYHIQQSMYVPFVSTLPRSGIRIPFSAIGSLFGLVEDVSPTMRFAVERPMPVEIVVYSSQARIVATIYKGTKSAGRYEYTWNGRDDNGRPLPPGDYIGEVRLGNEQLLRKRIQLSRSGR